MAKRKHRQKLTLWAKSQEVKGETWNVDIPEPYKEEKRASDMPQMVPKPNLASSTPQTGQMEWG